MDNAPDDQVQSDWTQVDETKNDYIKNKPELGALASQDEVAKDFLTADVQASLVKADAALESAKSYTDTIASGKANVVHGHDASYDSKGSANSALEVAKSYTNTAVAQKSQVQVITPYATEILPTLKIYQFTREQYNQALENGELEDHAIYLVPDEEIV